MSKEEKPLKTKIGKCKECGKVKEVTFDENPFEAEMNDDHKKVWLCLDCYNALAQEI